MAYQRLLICYCFFYGLCGSVAVCQNVDSIMREGSLYFDAGDYELANAQYRSLLDSDLTAWQNQVVSYDRGTVLLAQGRWEEAINSFQTVQVAAKGMPLLKQRLAANMALAKLLLATSRLDAIKEAASASLDQYINLFYLFHETFDDIEAAKASACDLDKAEGAQACVSSFDLDQMSLEASGAYAKLLKDFSEYTLSNTSVEEAASALWSGAMGIQDHLSFLLHQKMGSDLEGQYLEYYVQQGKSWGPLWEKLGTFLKNASSGDEKKEKLYRQSRDAFFKALEQMQSRALEQSLQSAMQSIDALQSLLMLVFEKSSLKETAQHLLVNYTLTIERDPMQKSSLLSLHEMQSRLGVLITKNNGKSEYQKAQDYLDTAVQSFNNFKPLHARIYLEEARYFIKDLVQKLDVASKEGPGDVLKNAIEAETLALVLNRLRQPLEEREGGGKDVDPLLLSSQERTVDIAEGFYKAVIAEQAKRFMAAYKDQAGPEGCQSKPWDTAVPLFTKGLDHARQANQVFSKNINRRKTAMALQESALREWQEVLKLLKQKKSAQTAQPSPAENKPEQPPQQMQKQREQQQGGTSFNDVMILLQQMENQDNSNPQILESAVRNQVERPW